MHPRIDPRVPLLRRSDGLQLGVDPDHGLLWTGDPDAFTALIEAMDGSRSPAELAELRGLDPAAVEGICATLTDRELLVPPRRRPPRVRLIGSGALARDLALALCQTRTARLTVIDPEPPPAKVYPHPRETGGDTLRRWLRTQGHEVDWAEHWFTGADTDELTIVADERAEPDRALARVLTDQRLPHLFCRPRVRGAILGPFVEPGRTSCLHCADLVLARDRHWPETLAQLCQVSLPVGRTLRYWLVGQTLATVRAWSAGTPPQTLGATVEIDRRWATAVRQWPRHPDCACAQLA